MEIKNQEFSFNSGYIFIYREFFFFFNWCYSELSVVGFKNRNGTKLVMGTNEGMGKIILRKKKYIFVKKFADMAKYGAV